MSALLSMRILIISTCMSSALMAESRMSGGSGMSSESIFHDRKCIILIAAMWRGVWPSELHKAGLQPAVNEDLHGLHEITFASFDVVGGILLHLMAICSTLSPLDVHTCTSAPLSMSICIIRAGFRQALATARRMVEGSVSVFVIEIRYSAVKTCPWLPQYREVSCLWNCMQKGHSPPG
jgi:hypothetical protein